LELQSGGFWGLFEGRRYHIPAQQLIVYPQLISLSHIGLHSMAPFGDLRSAHRLVEDPSRIFGVRPYVGGDSLRKIDWKTTAATNSLQVKRFQSSIALDSHIFLNLRQDDYRGRGVFTATELGITIAASLAFHFTNRRQTVGLSVLGLEPISERADFHDVNTGKGLGHLMQLLELLARIQRVKTSRFFEIGLPQHGAGLPWGTLVFVITASASEILFKALVGFRRQGMRPVLILTQPGGTYPVMQAKAREIGVECFRVEKARDLDIWRGGSPATAYSRSTWGIDR
jgi:uncharacterized protein (DUF58 family)